MSRLLLIGSLLTALTSSALASEHSTPQFARPVMSDRLMPHVMSRARVRSALAAARAENLARFRTYYLAKVYPSNTSSRSELNIWRDDDGRYCAAATIIKMSGHLELVEKVAEQSNSIKLATVTQGPVMDWILMSGLTQDEVALIQRPFRPVAKQPSEKVDVAVDARMRAKETARLLALYRQIDATLVKANTKSLEAATDRLMKQPRLATLLAGS